MSELISMSLWDFPIMTFIPSFQEDEIVFVTSNDEYGYLSEGEPTDLQLELQDSLDNLTYQYMQDLSNIHSMVKGKPNKEVEWDIGKLVEIREISEELMGLDDIY